MKLKRDVLFRFCLVSSMALSRAEGERVSPSLKENSRLMMLYLVTLLPMTITRSITRFCATDRVWVKSNTEKKRKGVTRNFLTKEELGLNGFRFFPTKAQRNTKPQTQNLKPE